MERLNHIKKKDTTATDFENYPVWTWEDSREYWSPLVVQGHTLPSDSDTMFVKARITIVDGLTFQGYVADSQHMFGIFIGEDEYVVNCRLTETIELAEQVLSKKYNREIEVLPASFETDFHFSDGRPLKGVLDIADDSLLL